MKILPIQALRSIEQRPPSQSRWERWRNAHSKPVLRRLELGQEAASSPDGKRLQFARYLVDRGQLHG